jgi:GT2 family glycosyltransferase
MSSHGQSPAQNRNAIAKAALEHDCTHILFIDDDQAFEKDALTKLLVHSDKDVVSALYLMRNFPHYALAFDELRPNGYCKHMFLTPDKQGLVEVVNCGFGFVLIKTDVFRALEQPWVRLGELDKDGWCDDIGFFNRVQEAGFKIYCDLSICIGHTINLVMWPRFIGGSWQTVYVTQTGQQFQFPQSLAPNGLVEKTGE